MVESHKLNNCDDICGLLISSTTKNILINYGLYTFADFNNITISDLLHIKGLGKTRVEELVVALEKQGVYISPK